MQFRQLLTDFWRCTLFSLIYSVYISENSSLKCFLNDPMCREDDATGICVVDKINIFRADRVFMVKCYLDISLCL